MTPGGSADVEDLGPELEFVELKIRNLSLADKTSLENFIRNIANWATNYFDFTDDQGTEYDSCLFWEGKLRHSQKGFQLFNEDILIAVGI